MRTVVVVVAHGSRLPAAMAAHQAVCDGLRKRLGGQASVEPAYLELTEPDIPSAIDGAVADGADRIVVLPYFLHPGNHTLRDIPEVVEAARSRHRGTVIDQAPMFGADPALVDTLAAQVSVAVDST